jgi:hypothetical protein
MRDRDFLGGLAVIGFVDTTRCGHEVRNEQPRSCDSECCHAIENAPVLVDDKAEMKTLSYTRLTRREQSFCW